MKFKVIRVFLIVAMLFVFLTGCNINLEIGRDKEEIKKEEVKTEAPKKEERKQEVTKEEVVKIDYFNIYTANIDTYKKEIKLTEEVIRTTEKDQRINQLKAITKSLSVNCFSGLPIEVIGIENVNGKDIATINLKESKENEKVVDPLKAKGETWQWQYMQGSAGGSITSVSLEETIMQREYNDKWIDGVQFLYNNEKIQKEHAPKLENVIYR